MNELVNDFPDIKVWHGYELLARLRTVKVVNDTLMRDVFEAPEVNGDLTKTWREAKNKAFTKMFDSGSAD